jgi:hypothetical protein
MCEEGFMKVNTLLKLTAVFGFVFGLAYLIFPKYLLDFFGVGTEDATIFTARFFGGAVLGYGVLAWATRNAEGSAIRRGIKLAIFVTCLIGLILSLLATFSGLFNAMGWIPIVFFLLITAAFGYFRFIKPSEGGA